MKKEKKEKFPVINREVALADNGTFYHKPIRIPAVVDENGIVMPNGKNSKRQPQNRQEPLI